jgi:type IV secretory pathway TraG/TraD family ATPase VirD4
VNGLTDFRLEWDSFWSEYHAKQAEKHLHEAKFADLHLYKHMLQVRRGVPSHILGNGYLNRHIKVYPPLHKREIGNVLDLGEGGLGKTNREKVEIADWEGSVVINDIKGELRRTTAGIRKFRFLKGRILTLNINGRGNQYDPLEGRNTERELYASAQHLLFREGERETYWTERATKMLTQLFLASREETRLIRRDNPFAKEVRPLPYVARMIRIGLNNVAARLNVLSPGLAQNFLEAEYVSMKDYEESKSRSDAWTTLTSRLYPLLTDEIVRSFNGSDFTAKDLLFSKDPVTVYLCWPEAELHSLLPLMRLVWEALTADIINTHDIYGHTTPQNILLSLDEAGRTGLTNLPDLLATFRSRQTYVSMSAQSLAQFKVHYGEYKTTVLLDNIQSLIIRRQKYDTARHVSDWLGARSGFALSRNKYSDDRHGEGETEREVPLFSPREIAELLDHQIIILNGGLKPIFANRVRRCDFPDVENHPHLQAPPIPLLPAPTPLPLLPAPTSYSRFPLWDRRSLQSGTYRLSARALGYAIPLQASE